VVASLAYSAAEEMMQHAVSCGAKQANIHNTLQFASRWLTTVVNEQVEAPWLGNLDNQGGQARDTYTTTAATVFDGIDNSREARIGLVGPACGYGLAHQNRDIAAHLGIDRWLVRGPIEPTSMRHLLRIDAVSRELNGAELEAWLDGLDAVLFVERPAFANLAHVARDLGMCVICVPNWEWLSPAYDWLGCVDVMLCPARHTARMLEDWKRRFGFAWQIIEASWPIDTDRFVFRPRQRCRQFVYVHGSGGFRATRGHESAAPLRRKGLEVLLSAARIVPKIPIVVYAQPRDMPQVPANVELRLPPADNRRLYVDGDVCVQPSHWEGLGLPLLECQAAGMPLVTTDAPPMNEHHPLAVIAAELEAVYLSPELCIPAARIEPQNLAATLAAVFGRDIRSPSRSARQFVEEHHSWRFAGSKICESIKAAVFRRHFAAGNC
jgi:glycosyltransferase involved in cell wall biosynthesis